MKKPQTITIEGRTYRWRVLLELRKALLEAWTAAQGGQPALFELRDDHGPKSERTAAGRYQEPSLLAHLEK